MKLEKIFKLTASFFCLVFFSNAYGSFNDNNPFQEKENYETHDYIFKQNNQENLQLSNPFFPELSETSNDYNKAGGPPGPPDDEETVPINNHLTFIFIIGVMTISLFAKKYNRLKHIKS